MIQWTTTLGIQNTNAPNSAEVSALVARPSSILMSNAILEEDCSTAGSLSLLIPRPVPRNSHLQVSSIKRTNHRATDDADSSVVIWASARTSRPIRPPALYSQHSEWQDCRQVPKRWSRIGGLC